ncbi:sedoheptulokinase [Parasteatoda tepidariorum]|uniref:sedoheptulokinase n=1 Tax=Parasteatoda tepidariorum TaxID=114398 RepID=UPI00077FBB1A|nr:sedoheptulokinase [Parasteatoda tepidariorum]
MSSEQQNLVLGIDIGTTTIKVCLVSSGGQVEQSASRETKSSMVSDLGPLGSEQDVHKICTALQFCLSRLPKESLVRVTHVAVSGQMHGCVLWKTGEGWKQNNFGRYETEVVSALYTWQDGRCSPEFLASLPKPDSHLRLSTGHACATILWLVKNKPDLIEQYDAAGTVQDLVVTMISGLERPIMSAQNAAGWGYFDTETRTWNTERLKEADFPLRLLPEVTIAGNIVGRMPTAWYGIPAGTPVFAALGDLQCSVFSSMETDHDAVMNLSTSAQLSFLLPEDFKPPPTVSTSSIEYFPYFKGRYLAVAASLNGGNVLAAFVKMLQQWTHELGLGVPEGKIWERITALAQDESSTDTEMEISPTLYGERHLTGEQRAVVRNIDPHCLGLGKVARSLFRGLISNLRSMMPRDFLIENGITRIIGSGTALTKNPNLQKELETQYDLPIVYGTGSDAAVGVALAVLPYL